MPLHRVNHHKPNEINNRPEGTICLNLIIAFCIASLLKYKSTHIQHPPMSKINIWKHVSNDISFNNKQDVKLLVSIASVCQELDPYKDKEGNILNLVQVLDIFKKDIESHRGY